LQLSSFIQARNADKPDYSVWGKQAMFFVYHVANLHALVAQVLL